MCDQYMSLSEVKLINYIFSKIKKFGKNKVD